MSNEDLPEPSEAQLAELNRMLGAPAVWAEPSDAVEDRVVAAIAAQRSDRGGPIPGPFDTPGDEADPETGAEHSTSEQSSDPGDGHQVVDLDEHRARRGGRRRFWPLAAAAAVLIVLAGGAGMVSFNRSESSEVTTVALAPTEMAPDASAVAHIDERPNGARLIVELSGLEPAPPGSFYEVWLVRDEPRTVISAGTFHMRGADQGEIEFWAGVSTEFYKTVTITLESEADPSAPGLLVLEGRIVP